MRQIKSLVVHCSATPEGRDVSAADIAGWHKAKGWETIGYHFVVRLDGSVEKGRPVEKAGAHVAGHNANTIGICLIGGTDKAGKPKATFTAAQLQSLRALLLTLREDFPSADIKGHRDFPKVAKACPSFDVRTWWATGEVKP